MSRNRCQKHHLRDESFVLTCFVGNLFNHDQVTVALNIQKVEPFFINTNMIEKFSKCPSIVFKISIEFEGLLGDLAKFSCRLLIYHHSFSFLAHNFFSLMMSSQTFHLYEVVQKYFSKISKSKLLIRCFSLGGFLLNVFIRKSRKIAPLFWLGKW